MFNYVQRTRTRNRLSHCAREAPDTENRRVAGQTRERQTPSVRDFHSFRVTWITLALAAGVPLELVQRVTGHRTVEIVMKHYFRPGREDFRQVLIKAMPKMLGQRSGLSPKEEMRRLLDSVKPSALREKLLKVWSKL